MPKTKQTSSVLTGQGLADDVPYCCTLFSINAINTQKQPKKKLSCDDVVNEPLFMQNRTVMRIVKTRNRTMSRMKKILPMVVRSEKVYGC